MKQTRKTISAYLTALAVLPVFCTSHLLAAAQPAVSDSETAVTLEVKDPSGKPLSGCAFACVEKDTGVYHNFAGEGNGIYTAAIDFSPNKEYYLLETAKEKGTAGYYALLQTNAFQEFKGNKIKMPITCYYYGDLNCDGSVDTEDIARIQQYVSGWNVKIPNNVTVTHSRYSIADVNCDNSVDTEDIARLQQYISGWNVVLGKIDDIPIGLKGESNQ